jgi:hypothetical protein
MVILSNSELRALFVQYQQHKDCIGVHITRGLFFGKLDFKWEEPEKKPEPKKKR